MADTLNIWRNVSISKEIYHKVGLVCVISIKYLDVIRIFPIQLKIIKVTFRASYQKFLLLKVDSESLNKINCFSLSCCFILNLTHPGHAFYLNKWIVCFKRKSFCIDLHQNSESATAQSDFLQLIWSKCNVLDCCTCKDIQGLLSFHLSCLTIVHNSHNSNYVQGYTQFQ